MEINKIKTQKSERMDKFIEELRLNPDMLSSYLDHINNIRRIMEKPERKNQSDKTTFNE